jgi:hypothetical protein
MMLDPREAMGGHNSKFLTLRVSPPTIIYIVFGVRVPVRNGWIEEAKETKQSKPAM